MIRPPHALSVTLTLLAAGIMLGDCQTDQAALGGAQPATVAAQPAVVAAQPAAPAAQPAPEPEEPLTVERASATCWMTYERQRRLSLDARAALVDKCIDDRMKAGH